MIGQNKIEIDEKNEVGDAVGGAEGGADVGRPGNILGGVQPSNENGGKTERRQD